MRTAQRDQDGMTVLSGYITDAPSGSGVASGVPYTFTRTGTGTYQVNFDQRLRAQTAVGSADNSNRVVMFGGLNGAGTVTVIRTVANTNTGENGGFFFSCTCLDKRT